MKIILIIRCIQYVHKSHFVYIIAIYFKLLSTKQIISFLCIILNQILIVCTDSIVYISNTNYLVTSNCLYIIYNRKNY